MAKKKDADSRKIVTTNRRALARYHVEDTMEAGLVLTGPEVKSLREGNANLQDGFIRFDNGQANLMNVYIKPYTHGSLHVNQEPTRTRRILLHKQEIMKWFGRMTSKNLTIVPLEIYFNKRGFAKIRIGLARGKAAPDRREEIKRRTVQREMQKEFSGKHRVR